jgi:hypothetical protein
MPAVPRLMIGNRFVNLHYLSIMLICTMRIVLEVPRYTHHVTTTALQQRNQQRARDEYYPFY